MYKIVTTKKFYNKFFKKLSEEKKQQLMRDLKIF